MTQRAPFVEPEEPAEVWEQVIPFGGIRTPEISGDFLPGWVGDFVREVSDCAQTPKSFGVLTAYATLAACLQQRFHVSPFGDSYAEPLNIWTVEVMAPG